jgi:hypothetical protein
MSEVLDRQPKKVEEYASEISNSFDGKIKQTGIGLDSNPSGVGEIQENFLGQKKDIVKDHIDEPNATTPSDFKMLRFRRLKELERKQKESFGYHMTDDRFNVYEKKLFGKEQQQQTNFYKKVGASFMGADGCKRAFSRHSRYVLQNSDVEERGQDSFKEKHIEDAIKGRRDVSIDRKEEIENGNYTLRGLKSVKRDVVEPTSKGLNYDTVTEQVVRNQFGLMFGRQRKNVNNYVSKATAEYSANNSHNSGSVKDVAGRFRGGFERINYLNDAQNKNEAQEDYKFTVNTKNRVAIEQYYYDYGNDNNADALIDINKDTENAGDLEIQN